MNLNDSRTVTAAFLVLDKWYAAHPSIRRLWAIQDSQGMRVIVTLAPTHDGDDIYPAWVANSHNWAYDLQSRTHSPVELEVMDNPSLAELPAGVDGVLIADVFWRDSSMP